jgi:hypothetical protein
MPNCSICGRSTELFIKGAPVCLACADTQERSRLAALGSDLTRAREEYRKAHEEFVRVGEVQDDFSEDNPDSSMSLRLANRNLQDAARRLTTLVNEYLEAVRGVK